MSHAQCNNVTLHRMSHAQCNNVTLHIMSHAQCSNVTLHIMSHSAVRWQLRAETKEEVGRPAGPYYHLTRGQHVDDDGLHGNDNVDGGDVDNDDDDYKE